MTVSTDQAAPVGVPAADDGNITLALRVAVTGHRDLADTPALSSAIDRALDVIMDQLPPNVRGRCRLVAVSALADGADRFVADRVLARPGAELEVILPMTRADYVADFDPVASLPEFEGLLAAASWVGTIPPQRTRKDAYYEAGRAVTDRADVTIAIWNGRPAAGKGGTGDIVGYLRRQDRPWIWIHPEGGRAVPENLGQLAAASGFNLADAGLASLDEFNRATLPAGRRAALIQDFQQTILEAGGPDLVADLTRLLGWLQGPFARAELVSLRFQSRYLRLSAMLFALAALAVCIVGTQLIFFPQVRLVVAGEVACLLVILGGLEWGRRTHVQQRWISARYLAERLRSAFFLALAGTGEEPSPSPFISTDIPAAPWVGTAFRMVWIRRPPLQVDGIPVASLRRFLSDAWIDDQRDYFERASERAGSAHLFSTRAVEILFALSVVIAIVHVTMPGPEDWFKHIVSLLAISIPACAAALVGYNAQREHLRNSQRYGRMVDGLVRANALMLAAGDQAHIRDVASTVDRMLREERGEWFGTVRLHELELPA